MGSYVRIKRSKSRSVSETLTEAEEDHFLDCPNAEIRLRGAALLLDVLLSVLVVSGLQHLCNALNTHLGHINVETYSASKSFWAMALVFIVSNSYAVCNYLFISLKVAFFYFYFIWSVTFSGGSPGKLLLGLRVINVKTGQLLSFSSAFFREGIIKPFSIALLGVGLFPALIRPDKRAFQDLASNSVVKRVHGGL